MIRRLLLLLLALGICLPAAVPASAAGMEPIQQAVRAALQKADEKYPISDDAMQTLPPIYAEAAEAYDLTDAEITELAAQLYDFIVVRDEYADDSDPLSIADSVDTLIRMIRRDAAIRSYRFAQDAPSAWARERIATKIVDGRLPEAFQRNFTQPITLGQMAELFFPADYWQWMDRVDFQDGTVNNDSSYAVKAAFLFGLIDSADETDRTLTRQEAAVKLARSFDYGLASAVNAKDFAAVDPEFYPEVAGASDSGLVPLIDGKFLPQQPFTVQDAIFAADAYSAHKIRGLLPYLRDIDEDTTLTVGRDYASFRFSDPAQARSFIAERIEPMMGTFKLTGGRQRIDLGYAVLELWAPDAQVKYLFKKDVRKLDFNDALGVVTYGTGVYSGRSVEGYLSEPRALKAGETPDMTPQPDSYSRKLYAKLDPILAKLIKPSMTDEQKVKAIFDYVVKHMRYSGNPNFLSSENALIALDKGVGVCVHYTMLFHYMAKRSGLQTIPLQGNSIAGQHTWNMVKVNGKWLFVDTTFADTAKGIDYSYYLKDAWTMFKTREWQGFGYPDYANRPAVDGNKIATTDELRTYLVHQLWQGPDIPPTKIKFRLVSDNVDTDIRFLKALQIDAKYKVSIDKKTQTYTLTLIR